MEQAAVSPEQAAVSPELSNTERSMGEDYAADQPPTAARSAAEIANRVRWLFDRGTILQPSWKDDAKTLGRRVVGAECPCLPMVILLLRM
jgi:hypothetical protein